MLQILVRRLLILVLLAVLPALAGDVDTRIHQVKTIFVAGNSQDADTVRKMLAKGKTCFALSTKAADADAVLDVREGTRPKTYDDIPGANFSTNGTGPSATLKLKSGDLIWSISQLSDGIDEDIVRQLARDACSKRK